MLSSLSVGCVIHGDFYVHLILRLFLIFLFSSLSHHHSSIGIIICTWIGNSVSIDCLGCTAPNLSQNMFFTGTTIPLTDVMHQNHQSVAMAQNRTPPTLFQYPSKYLIAFTRSPRVWHGTRSKHDEIQKLERGLGKRALETWLKAKIVLY